MGASCTCSKWSQHACARAYAFSDAAKPVCLEMHAQADQERVVMHTYGLGLNHRQQ